MISVRVWQVFIVSQHSGCVVREPGWSASLPNPLCLCWDDGALRPTRTSISKVNHNSDGVDTSLPAECTSLRANTQLHLLAWTTFANTAAHVHVYFLRLEFSTRAQALHAGTPGDFVPQMFITTGAKHRKSKPCLFDSFILSAAARELSWADISAVLLASRC